jgi:hypothetical protein
MKAQDENLIKGILVVGAITLLPVAIRYAAPLARSVARSTLKAGVLAYEKGCEVKARLDEAIEDAVAEVREELRDEREAKEMAARLGEQFRAAQSRPPNVAAADADSKPT